MLEIKIRPFIPEDYDQAAEVLKNTKMFDQVWDSKENYLGMIKKDPESILVAADESKVIGTQVIIPYGPEMALLFRLAVLPECRNQGIGGRLLETAEEILAKRGVKEVAFFVDAENKDLQEYYAKKGHRTSGHLYVCMWKPLN
jgi:ribosomal protein S18 acetylase RimI-like enzyme